MEREILTASISRMLENLEERKLRIVYLFVLHLAK